MNDFTKKTGKIPGPTVDLPGAPGVAFTISICILTNGQVGDINGPKDMLPHAVIDVLATAIKMMAVVIQNKQAEPSRIIIPKLVGLS